VNTLPDRFKDDVDTAVTKLEDGWGLPTTWYRDPDIYRFEMNVIFGREWQYLAPTEMLSKAGDCVVGRAAEVPVVVTCGADGTIEGFVNMCRHRGHPVAHENGNVRALVCPYHGWTYSLDGTLKRAPECDHEPGFNTDELSLLRVGVDVWGPAVFVNADPNAPPLRTLHPRFEEICRTRELTPDVDAYRFRRRVAYPADCNWKLWYDNNAECYHCPRIHAKSFASAYKAAPEDVDNYEIDRMFGYRFDAAEMTDDSGELRSTNYRSVQLFPGITIIQQDDLMMVSQIIPYAPEHTVSVWDYFAERGTDEDRFERWFSLWNQTFTEDLTAVSAQQRGMRTGFMERSRLIKTAEPQVVAMNRAILEAYRQGLRQI
tara:strand:- start:91 stop:1209 length:1119 start_codon:yes stop_codon:yes gene_type:complete